ncbi:TrkA family potassium uptake protein [Oceanidesulfovibrio indonesiensis]|uniref:Trk system potassium uptake protein TrkA n=1 Tax=Oceanidesulfovibrio indonesiensis TaxID=54767 RepID=A0A7M3MAW7_9BACT|nr:NAD-binding protein [Oceanidesulfovibrio indonesiensis]TVM15035.1 TrkA family potassium uptake protein [Oceanidesulfovibrio indonesiensis]
MRIVFIGASDTTVRSAELLIDKQYEVVIIEKNKERIDQLIEHMDCSFLHGDGSSPAMLKETNPEKADVLFCLSDSDQSNLIAGLVGRSMGFERIIVSIIDPDFEPICRELGLTDTIIPTRTISRFLADMVEGVDVLELRTVIKGAARIFSFTAGSEDAGAVGELDLPTNARVVCLYREQEFILTDDSTKIRKDDEVVVLTHSKNMDALHERWTRATGSHWG